MERLSDGASAAVGNANARMAARYDELPYGSHPRSRSHPARIAMIAQLLGLTPPPPINARILEIGCASGGHIIPLAAQYPNSRIVGLDLSGAQIASGLARVDRLGLANIELIRGDLVEFSPQPEKFEYILCHGVYSWAPIEVRARIQRLIAANLSPQGIAYVSYNVLPGWRLRQTLRDVLTSAVRHFPDLAAKVVGARAFLDLLRGWGGSKGPYASNLCSLAARLERAPDDYLAHEYLAEDNHPQTFVEFVEEVQRAGLAYLGDLDLWMTLPENFDPEFRRLLSEACGGALLPSEQMIDVLLGREFRRSLLVHESVIPQVSRALDRSCIEGLNFFGRMDETAGSPQAWTFLGPDNQKLSLSAPSARRALHALSRAYPASLTLDELVQAGDGSEPRGSRETRGEVVYLLFMTLTGGMIDARVDPVPAASLIDARPRVPRHCRIDALAGEAAVATLIHEPFFPSDAERVLLQLLDGTRDRDALARALVARVSRGELKLSRQDVGIVDSGELYAFARSEVDRALEAFRTAGLLEQA